MTELRESFTDIFPISGCHATFDMPMSRKKLRFRILCNVLAHGRTENIAQNRCGHEITGAFS